MIIKVIFKARQRRTVAHARKYVISNRDLSKVKNTTKEDSKHVDQYREFKKLWRYFEPDEDKWDRRLLYDVTGIRLDQNEFRDSDTSDEENQALIK